MYAIAILRYRKPLEEVLQHLDAHRAYCQGLKQEGLLIASGPFTPRSGGALVLRCPTTKPRRHSTAFATTIPSRGSGSRNTNCGPGRPPSVRRTSTVSNIPSRQLSSAVPSLLTVGGQSGARAGTRVSCVHDCGRTAG